jgi:predicted enzyme related to lactoylglutathione lyase
MLRRRWRGGSGKEWKVMGKVVHFEIPADDIARAKEFYSSIFGWQLQDMESEGMDYTIVMTTPVDQQTQLPTEPGAINGGMMKRAADTPSPVITIEVDGIEDALKQVEAGGGSTVQTRTEIPGMGAFAYFKDPEGNVLGLWESV